MKSKKPIYNLETLARIELSDIKYLISQLDNKNTTRFERIIFETIVSKISATFQLAIRAYDYFELSDQRQKLIGRYSKNKNSALGQIGNYRADLFHDGIHFVDKTIFFQFGRIKGRGFKAIHVKKGSVLIIGDIFKFSSSEKELAITSEGIFEIYNSGDKNETWIYLENFPSLISIDYKRLIEKIDSAVKDIEEIWFEISKVNRKRQAKNQSIFKDEQGEFDIIEKRNGKINTYQMKETKIVIEGGGVLSISPPERIEISKDGTIEYK
jgi:hypothetical protein